MVQIKKNNSNNAARTIAANRYQQGEEKDSDTENDNENGLRMKSEMTMKEKDLVFLPTRKKEKRKADPHLAHCLLPDTQANASQKSKSQILPTH